MRVPPLEPGIRAATPPHQTARAGEMNPARSSPGLIRSDPEPKTSNRRRRSALDRDNTTPCRRERHGLHLPPPSRAAAPGRHRHEVLHAAASPTPASRRAAVPCAAPRPEEVSPRQPIARGEEDAPPAPAPVGLCLVPPLGGGEGEGGRRRRLAAQMGGPSPSPRGSGEGRSCWCKKIKLLVYHPIFSCVIRDPDH